MSAPADPNITSGKKVSLWLDGAGTPLIVTFRGQEGATVYFDFGPVDLHHIDRIELYPNDNDQEEAVSDPTENIRRQMIDTGQPAADFAATEAAEAPTWTTETLQQEFEVIGFMAPFVVVRRRSDRVKGTLEFTHSPRVYFNFEPTS